MAPMNHAVKSATPRPLDRLNLRLSAEMFQAIDDARSRRPGNVSRNSWIAEAIQEKLLRESASNDPHPRAGGR